MTRAAELPEGAQMKRVKYYDLLRIISFFLVTFFHMLSQLALCGICPMERVAPFFQNGNAHIATLAVALFFMLSGAGLTLSARSGLSLGKYYKGRFLRLMIPFYLAVLLTCGVRLAATGRLPEVFYAGLPAWHFGFTVAGMDGWMSLYGVGTFYVGIGEWFLGELVVLTALFPLMRLAQERFPRTFFAACTGLYLWVAFHYRSAVQMHEHILLKGYEFVLGMYFAKYCRRFPGPCVVAAVLVTALFAFGPALPLNYALKITLLAAAVFVAFSGLEPLLQGRNLAFLVKLQAYTYPLFLVHHKVIYAMTSRFAPYYRGLLSIILLFIAELAATFVLAAGIKWLSNGVTKRINERGRT